MMPFLLNFEQIIKDKRYYDSKIVDFLLSSIDDKDLKSYETSIYLSTFIIKCNLYGLISIKKDENNDLFKQVETFNKKLNEESLIKVQDPNFKKLEIKCSINLINALKQPQLWLKENDVNILTKDEKVFLLAAIINDKVSIYEKDIELIKLNLDILMENLEDVKKMKEDSAFINSLLKSKNFQLLLCHFNFKDKIIFSDDTLLNVWKVGNLKENVSNHQYQKMMCKLIESIPSDRWIKSLLKYNKSILFWLLPSLQRISGIKNAEIEGAINQSKNIPWKNIVISQISCNNLALKLNYLAKDLKQQKISDLDLEKLYAFVFLINNKDLYMAVRNIYNLPSPNFKTKYVNDLYVKNQEIEIEFRKKQLEEKINSNEITNNNEKKIKI